MGSPSMSAPVRRCAFRAARFIASTTTATGMRRALCVITPAAIGPEYFRESAEVHQCDQGRPPGHGEDGGDHAAPRHHPGPAIGQGPVVTRPMRGRCRSRTPAPDGTGRTVMFHMLHRHDQQTGAIAQVEFEGGPYGAGVSFFRRRTGAGKGSGSAQASLCRDMHHPLRSRR